MAWEEQAKSFTDMFKRLGEAMHMPSVDINAVLDSQRKNLEALEQSARATAEGAASLAAKQRDAIAGGLRDATEMAQNLKMPAMPHEMVGRQAEFARRTFEAAVKNAGEMAEIMRKSGTESVDILRNRMRESVEEAMKSVGLRK